MSGSAGSSRDVGEQDSAVQTRDPAHPRTAEPAQHVDERPGEPSLWERLYRLWIAHADPLRRELGEAPAERMLAEAQQVLPTPAGRRAVLLTLRRAPDPPHRATVADRMPPPAPTERTPQ
ncbi:hypothetical protein [Streptomyces halstedii]|uniref:hypothetical protein n=1 Tax=Streptomyces halstedii TaxID=1944 RepID=UPI0033597651